MKKRQNQPAKPTNSNTPSVETAPVGTFSDHIGELRRRIMWIALVFVVASSAAYSYRDILLQIIMAPLQGEKLIYLTPGGGFSFIFQVTMYAGILVAAPMLLHQLYGFIRPALPSHAQRSAPKVVLCAVLLMLAGVSYGYFVAIPSALNFLNTFAGEAVSPSLTADSYLSFFLAYIAGLGLLFQLPLLLMFWHWIKPMGPTNLLKSERWVILFSFVAAALITPTPDVVNQAMIAVPLIAIYQLGVAAVLVSIMRSRRAEKRVRRHAPAPIAAVSVHIAPEIPTVATVPIPVSSVAQQTILVEKTVPSKGQPRSVDGFTKRSHQPMSIKRPPIRPLPASRQQPVRLRPSLERRTVLSIDGVLTA